MRFTVKRSSFLKALQAANQAVPSRTTKDIIRNVLLEAKTNAITLVGTDTEIGLRVEVSDVVQSDAGVCLLPTMRVLQVLGEFDDASDVRFEVESGAVWIRGGGRGTVGEFRLSTEDPDGFPRVKGFDEENVFVVKAADFRRVVKRTMFACDNESTRYALGGVQMEFNINKTLICVATDSRRLAIDQAPFTTVGAPEAPAVAPVIPSKALKLIVATMDDGEVQVAFNKNGISFRAGLVTMTSQLVQGRFPDWRRIMPGKAEQAIDLPVGQFLSAMRQILIMRSEESRAAEFAFARGMLRLSSSCMKTVGESKTKKGEQKTLLSEGESKTSIPIRYEGEAVAINFDAVYVSEALKVLESSGQVQFNLSGVDDPGLLVAGEFREFQYVIMPIMKE